MNPDVFFRNFELLADAPNGVQKLRELILQLAVRGKLVPHDPNDEPTSVLLERIKYEKERLVEKGVVKQCKPLRAVEENEIPYKLPEEWQWVRLEDLVSLLGDGLHGTPQYSDHGDYFFIDGNNLSNGEILVKSDTKRVSVDEYNKYKKELNQRTILVSINGTLGNVAFYNNEKIILGKSACYFNLLSGISKFYLKLLINTSYFLEYAFNNATGTTIKNVSLKSMRLFLVPLPPLTEQKRIVSKVDELMILCDKLEARRQKKQEIQSKLNSAALDRMLSAENQEEFEQNWQRICENFDLLYDNPENVEKLKQAILQLAVQGKLVEQNPEDEPASVLIEKIKAEREKLGEEGKIKKNESFPEIDIGEMPYDLPERWEWVRLGNLCELITKGSSPKWQGVSYVEKSIGILFITSENVGNYSVNLDKEKYVEQKFNEIEPRSILKRKDILMNIVGASIGRTAIYESDEIANINQAVCLIRVIGQDKLLNLRYLLHFFNSPTCVSYMFDKQVDNARANLSMGNISKFVIPIPPLSEQKRIVEKVDQFMGLCDELETKLRKQREDSEKLMEAVVKGLLEGEVTEKPELDKPIPLQAAVVKLK